MSRLHNLGTLKTLTDSQTPGYAVRVRLLLGIASEILGLSLTASIAQSQITPDSTFNTTITQSGNNFTIMNGTAVGTNLYHSFGQFWIPTGGSATFDLISTPTIRTIFSRITGAMFLTSTV